MKQVRTAVARLQRRGYTTLVRRHEALDTAGFAEMAGAAAQWRGDGGDERGFSMALGRVEDPLDGDCVLVTARDADGALRGFLSFVPWGRNGLSLDLMRRDPTADNGLIELMVSALAERSARLGVGPASLNFAMFREAFERGAEIGAGPVARLWRQALLLASRNWQLESLYRSNAKYQPAWQPRFLCFEYASDLPRVGAAAGNAEGFLSRPSLSRFLRRGGAEDGGTLASDTLEYADSVRRLIPPPEDAVAAALACPRDRPLSRDVSAQPHAGGGVRGGRHTRPGHLDGHAGLRDRSRPAQARPRWPRVRHLAGRERRPPGDGEPGRRRIGGPRPLAPRGRSR
jgi:lysyl-tRNA synthetase class 2